MDTTAPIPDARIAPALPANFPRRILLAVTGLSPQIVTETLYALALRDTPPWIPTEVHLITTATGKREAELNLLAHQQPAGDPGWFHRLRADYDLPPIRFDTDHIHVLCDAAGAALDDIRMPADNERAADFITEIVRRLTGDAHSQLHVSIAGGRKTMGYYLGYALSLYGRAQDQLSHVLVSEPFENNREFYYPTPYRRPIAVRRGATTETHDAQQARVDLARIPFVRLREGLPDALLAGETSFSGTVQVLNRVLGPPRLVIEVDAQGLYAGGEAVKIHPADLAFALWFARRARLGQPGLLRPADGVPEPAYATAYLAEYDRLRGRNERIDKRYRHGMTQGDFDERRSRLNKSLRAALGRAGAAPYLIEGVGHPKRYALALPPGAIEIKGE
jgi:CRISPR-associated protein (TIGR02584 family)